MKTLPWKRSNAFVYGTFFRLSSISGVILSPTPPGPINKIFFSPLTGHKMQKIQSIPSEIKFCSVRRLQEYCIYPEKLIFSKFKIFVAFSKNLFKYNNRSKVSKLSEMVIQQAFIKTRSCNLPHLELEIFAKRISPNYTFRREINSLVTTLFSTKMYFPCAK